MVLDTLTVFPFSCWDTTPREGREGGSTSDRGRGEKEKALVKERREKGEGHMERVRRA